MAKRTTLKQRQRTLAERVAAVGHSVHASPKELKAAAETGLVESNFRNLPVGAGDADSGGWRQERASLYPDPTNVEASARRFFDEAAKANQPGISAGELAARVQRPAAQYRGRYQDASGQADQLLSQIGAGGGAAAPSSIVSDLKLGTKTTFDQAGYDAAQKKTLLASMIAQREGTRGVLFKTGLLSTQAPDPAAFTKTDLTSEIVRSGGQAGTGAADGSGRVPGRPGGKRGQVAFAAGADRPGVKTKPVVRSFLSELAGTLPGGRVDVGTGTNHNRMTTDGNVSDHWTGHATDLPVPVDSHQGDQIAYHALRLAGVPHQRAVQVAHQGGLFTLYPTSGQLAGHRVQVIWKTNQGGNHHNHVHVGIR